MNYKIGDRFVYKPAWEVFEIIGINVYNSAKKTSYNIKFDNGHVNKIGNYVLKTKCIPETPLWRKLEGLDE